MTGNAMDPKTSDELRARDAMRQLRRPRADEAFRESLKREFVTGRIGGRAAIELPVTRRPRPAWRFALAMGAAAALVVVVALANRGPGWTVLATSGDGIAIVDQAPVPLAHAEELGRRLHAGARVITPAGAEIELASAGGLVVEVTAGTEFTLPASPGRWFGRRVTGAVGQGEIRLTTGPAFHGAQLHLDTPEAAVEVTGTTLAVICEPAGTCVCVHDGLVRVAARGQAAESVPGGRRRFVFRDGRPPELANIRDTEVGRLGAFRERRRAWLMGGAE